MKPCLALSAALLLLLTTLPTRAADPPASQPAYSLWDTKETPAQYAKRNNIKLVEQTLDLGQGTSLKVTLIPAGKFLMGINDDEAKLARTYMHNGAGDPSDEMPQHEVTISKPFYMSTTVITQAQCLALVNKPSARDLGPRNPQVVLNYDAALDFCKTLSQKSNQTVRLPTEAEWEFACRAGTTTAFNTGPTISTDQANYEGDKVWGTGKPGPYRAKVLPVASFKPNPWNLYDMHGNVPEWCADWYDPNYYAHSPALDPPGPDSGTKRVVRGGSAHTPPRILRSAARDAVPPATTGIALRIIVELK